MSGIVNKIKDAVTGTHTTHTTTGAAPLGTAQVRDTNLGMHSTNSSLHSSSASSLHSSSASTMGTSTAGSSHMTGLAGTANAALGHIDNAMTRSEEHLLVGKEKVNAGKAALHKYVTKEHVATTVPLVKEHAVVEREPITEANRAAAVSGPDFKEAHYEVNLMEERAVTEKEEVPIERVRLRKEQEVVQQHVGADLRKEHIEVVDGGMQGKTYDNAIGTQSRMGTDVNSQARRM